MSHRSYSAWFNVSSLQRIHHEWFPRVVLDSHCIALGICLQLRCLATGPQRTFSPTFALIHKRPDHFQLTVCEIMIFQGHVWNLGICSRPFRNLVPQNCRLVWFWNFYGFWFVRELQFATLDVFQISAQPSGQMYSRNFKSCVGTRHSYIMLY